MSNREIAVEAINKLPEDTPLDEIAGKLALIAGLRRAREEAARGEGMDPEKARELVNAWVSR